MKRSLATLVVLGALAPRSARAGDATVAEALFREGKALMTAGDYAHACPKLQESFNVDPATGTLLALALCQEQRGFFASAWTVYSEVASRAHGEGRSDREQAARERVSALAPRLSKLVVQVPAEVAALPGLVVKRDGQPLTDAAWGSALPVDGGEHSVEVSADGKKPWRVNVTVAPERDAQTVTVPALEAAAPATTSVQPVATLPEPRREDAPAGEASSSVLRPIGLVSAGLGVVGLGVGTVFGLKAKSDDKDSKADGHCDSTGCDATGKGLRNDAFSAARVSTALFVAGGVLVAGGVTLYLLGAPKREGTSVALAPGVGSLALYGGF